jgi:acyl carrier protein
MERFYNLLEEVFEKSRDEIKMEDVFRDYEGWDSLTLLGLSAIIHEEYGLTISRADYEKIQTISELYEYIEQHK